MKKDNQNKKIDPGLVQRYLLSAGKKDQKKIEEWFGDLRANEELRKFSKTFWNSQPGNTSLSGYDENRVHDRLHHILRLEEATAMQKATMKRRIVTAITRIAAVLLIPLALFTLALWRGNLKGDLNVSYSEIYSPFGTRTSFVLPDGSTGWLNGGSSLKFPTQFRGKSRTVELTGEAFFVAHENPKRPFSVTTQNLIVKAYGTSFDVKAYPEEISTDVVLESGEIEVLSKDESGRERSLGKMAPGERGIFLDGMNRFIKNSVDPRKYTSWKEGKLVFYDEPMNQIVNSLNRWYNVDIKIKDKRLESFRYRATFVDEKLDEVLKILESTSPIVHKEIGREKLPDGTYGKRKIELYYRPNS